MISSPCSAEQAQRIKLYSRKSPPQSFPPSAQQAPGHFVRGLPLRFIQDPPRGRSRTAAGELEGARPASNEIDTESPRTAVRGLCASSKTRRAAGHTQPRGSSRGQGPPRMRSIQKALGQPSGGFPCASSKTRRAAGHAQPQGSSRGHGPPRMRSIQKALGHFVRGLPLRFIQNPPRGKSRTAAGELEGARPASNEINAESPRTFRPGAFCILFFSCCAFSARSPASAAGSGSRRSWR